MLGGEDAAWQGLGFVERREVGGGVGEDVAALVEPAEEAFDGPDFAATGVGGEGLF